MDSTMLFDHASLSWLTLLLPLGLSTLLSSLMSRKFDRLIPLLVTGGTALSLLFTVALWIMGPPTSLGVFWISPLTFGMMTLTLFVSSIIGQFSRRYLDGDKRKGSYFKSLGLLTIALCFLNVSNHIALFAGSWALAAACLTQLIGHRKKWSAAQASAKQTGLALMTGLLMMTGGLLLLALEVGSPLISTITSSTVTSHAALVLIALGVAIQSGLYPFEKWLIGSVNAPTPVSALMHAGLINGGGILLVKLSGLLIQAPLIMALLLGLGLASAITSTFRKLLQPSIKTMLAHSTSAQMGFMVVQCSLGLFPAAITHLMWHGLFKAHLFLGSGSAAEAPAAQRPSRPSLLRTVFALFSAALGAWVFHAIAHPPLFSVGIIFLSGAQSVMGMMGLKGLASKRMALLAGPLMGLSYGLTVSAVEHLMGVTMPTFAGMPLLSSIAFGTLSLFWLAFHTPFAEWIQSREIWRRIYAKAYLKSLPNQQTWTLTRGDYDR